MYHCCLHLYKCINLHCIYLSGKFYMRNDKIHKHEKLEYNLKHNVSFFCMVHYLAVLMKKIKPLLKGDIKHHWNELCNMVQ